MIGLGYIKGIVKCMMFMDGFFLFYIGWNNINYDGIVLFEGIGVEDDFYFVYSFFFDFEEDCIVYFFDYGGDFIVYVEKGNVRGV